MIPSGCIMIYCNSCGESNPDEATYCWKCGKPLYKHTTESGSTVPSGLKEDRISCRTNEDIIEESNVEHHETVEELAPAFVTDFADTVKETNKEHVSFKKDLKKECDQYRIPTILCGFVSGLFIIAMCFTLTQEYQLNGLISRTESYTIYELAMTGWNNTLTLIVFVILILAVLSFVSHKFSIFSGTLMLLSLYFSIRFNDVTIGYFTYDVEIVKFSIEEMIMYPQVITMIGIVIIVFIGDYCFEKYKKQFGPGTGTLETIKHLWMG